MSSNATPTDEFIVFQKELYDMVESLRHLQPNRRAVSLAITHIETARLWLGQAIGEETKLVPFPGVDPDAATTTKA